jgi:type IV pilus assembly protein PilW
MITQTLQHRQPSQSSSSAQHGMTLVELMVGIAIGLLVIAVAMGALMVSRGVSGTVSDASQLQQQASYALRVFGQQIRQAGSMRLNLAANKNAGDPIAAEDVVAFAPDTNLYSANPNVAPAIPIVSGKDSPSTGEFKLSTVYQNYTEPSFTSSGDVSPFRDCLGNQPSATLIQSQFVLKDNELLCAGTDGTTQPIIRNVANFQVRYLVQSDALTGNPKMTYVNATTAGADWGNVFGVEICFVLYGDERLSLPAGTSYLDCDNTTVVDMTTLTDANRLNRMHKVFRAVYQVRSQGLVG